MEQFHHFNLEEREKLFLWKQSGVSVREIGRRLGRSYTSVSHEWKRNKTGIGKRQQRMKLWRYLRLHRKKRMKKDGRKVHSYAKLASALPIAARPDAANNRTELGHVETDNMEGKKVRQYRGTGQMVHPEGDIRRPYYATGSMTFYISLEIHLT